MAEKVARQSAGWQEAAGAGGNREPGIIHKPRRGRHSKKARGAQASRQARAEARNQRQR